MSKNRSSKQQAKNRAMTAKRRARLKEAGMCVSCGVKEPPPSKRDPNKRATLCVECAKKDAQRSLARLNRHRPAWAKLGICLVCGCREAMPQQSRCAYCAEKQDETKARKKQEAA